MTLFLRFQETTYNEKISADNQGNKLDGLCGFSVDDIEDARERAERYTRNCYYGHLASHAVVYEGEYMRTGNDGVLFKPYRVIEVIR